MTLEILESEVTTKCRWELIQSFCFDEDVFLCLIKGCDERYFLFISEDTKVNDIYEFEGLKTAQEHFSNVYNELSKDKQVNRVILSK